MRVILRVIFLSLFGFVDLIDSVVGCLSKGKIEEVNRDEIEPRIPKDESSGLDGYSDRRLKTGIKYLTK